MNLNQPYNRDSCIDFLQTFVPGFKKDIRKAEADRLQVTEEACYLGESEVLDIAVFELTHTSSTDARVSLSMDGFKLMKASAVYRALIIYRSENNEDWRFSLMTATPDLDEEGNVVRKLSNPRRFSFFLGPNAKINTPNQFLIKGGPVKSFEDLQTRFSLEVVNKEFYKQISEKFTQLVGGTLGTGKKQKTYEPLIKLPSQSSESQINMEFGVRLIGRIIFCWFLREKKSTEGLSLMPKELLSFDATSNNSNYYHSILEPIFFEVLNKEHRGRREDYAGEPFSHIPYLNGGLFSPHEDDYYKRPNGEQSIYQNTLVVPDAWLKDLFEILETYNFTIDENTSFDEELSIDPEMLGRIFENLLAEINPETGESARKSTGSYYTPRVIVDYMVDESILLYLQEHTKIAEEKLRAVISYDLSDDEEHPLEEVEKKQIVKHLSKLKLLDPACGSGAFPIGALQKIVFVLQQIDQDGQYWLQKQLEGAHPEFRRDIEKKYSNKELNFLRKLGIIRECIFGVDIQPIATEIARLRCFLTLIVDERIDDVAENRGIKPLPNLDFKFVTANSLIDLPKIEESSDQIQMFDDREKIEDLKSVRDQYFNSYGIEREQLKTEFITKQKRLINDLVEEHDFMGLEKAILTSKLTSWEPFTHKSSPWFDPEWMFGITDGFDIVIANPPYLSEKGHKEIFRDIKNNSSLGEFYLGKMDLFYFFFHLALNLGKEPAQIAFISTDYYPTASGAKKMREDFKNRTVIRNLLDFNELKIFKSATGQHNLISILTKSCSKRFKAKTLITNRIGDATTHNIEKIVRQEDEQTSYYQIEQDNLYDGEDNFIRLRGAGDFSNPIDILLEKIKYSGLQLGGKNGICEINQGLKTNADKVFPAHVRKGLTSADVGSGIFVINDLERESLNLLSAEERFVRPFYKNSHIAPYYTFQKSSEHILYITNDNYLTDDDVNIKSHLSKFESILKSRAEVEPSGRVRLYSITRPRKQEMYINQKIVCPLWAKSNTFGYNDNDWYGATDITYITNPKFEIPILFILSILNSKLILFWLLNKGKKKGNLLELSPRPVSEIPIKKISDSEQQRYVKIVDEILNITKVDGYLNNTDLQSQVKEYERKIDTMVYELYELTPEEIEIVENSYKENVKF